MPKMFLKDTAVASRYDISRASVWNYAKEDKLPKPIKLSNGSTRWRLDDLLAFEKEMEVLR